MTRRERSVVIIGAGIFGATAAIELRRRGAAVTLLDPGPLPHPDAASTDISKVIRMDYGSDTFYTALMEQALQGWDAWNRRWGEPLYHETGFLILAREPVLDQGFERSSFALLTARGHTLDRMTPDKLRERHPAWAAERYPDGYFNARGGWAESGKVVAKLIEEARAAGVTLVEGFTFARLLEEGSRVTGVVGADGERRLGDVVLVAAGAWTPTLLPHLGDRLWAVGQPVLHFRAPDHDFYRAPRFPPWAADIARTGWYGFPALPDGTLKIANHGAGRRMHPDEPRVVGAGEEAKFRAFLADTFPGLVGAPLLGSRLCLYCDTWDGSFWIDHDPDRPGLVVAAGGSGHAFKFAPVLGGIIADVITHEENPHARRFAWRARGALAVEEARNAGDGEPTNLPGQDGPRA